MKHYLWSVQTRFRGITLETSSFTHKIVSQLLMIKPGEENSLGIATHKPFSSSSPNEMRTILPLLVLFEKASGACVLALLQIANTI